MTRDQAIGREAECTCGNVRIMDCPQTNEADTLGGRGYWRRRQCSQCAGAFSTLELPATFVDGGWVFGVPGASAARFFRALACVFEHAGAKLRGMATSRAPTTVGGFVSASSQPEDAEPPAL